MEVRHEKTSIVTLSNAERQTLLAVVKKLKGTSQKVRRANILLKADTEGPHWTDQQIADAFFCSRQSVENDGLHQIFLLFMNWIADYKGRK